MQFIYVVRLMLMTNKHTCTCMYVIRIKLSICYVPAVMPDTPNDPERSINGSSVSPTTDILPISFVFANKETEP